MTDIDERKSLIRLRSPNDVVKVFNLVEECFEGIGTDLFELNRAVSKPDWDLKENQYEICSFKHSFIESFTGN
jgi:hypothetical protein